MVTKNDPHQFSNFFLNFSDFFFVLNDVINREILRWRIEAFHIAP